VVLVSTTPEGLQELMNALAAWCSKNVMVLNAIKLAGIIFGPIPQILPTLKFGDEHVLIGEKPWGSPQGKH
jgi:hypothetical protein